MKKNLLKVLSAGFCLALMIGIANATPVQWTAGAGANGHWYDLVDGTLSWTDAKVSAEGAGGYLATITSVEEQSFVASLITGHIDPDNLTSGYMIGGFQPAGSKEPLENWQWVTAEAWNYQNWGAGEANNWLGNENYLYMDERYGWSWNDYESVNSYYGMACGEFIGYSGYIFESASAPIPEPATVLLLGTGLAFVAGVHIRRRK